MRAGTGLLVAFTALLAAAKAPASTGPAAPRPAQTAAAPATPASAAERSRLLSEVFSDYWEDQLRTQPEFASTIGDRRYNDRLADRSVAAYNQALARERTILERLAAIDTTGLSDQEKLSKDLLSEQIADDQEEADFKPWEMPVSQMSGFPIEFPQLVNQLSFTSVKDYEDWIARIEAAPRVFADLTANMSLGIEDRRVPPRYILEKALVEVKTLAGQKPEESPFARPLRKFPASVPAAEQARIRTAMLAAISGRLLPAYQRFGRFLESEYIPAGRSDPGLWALADGDRYYRFLVRRSTTTSLTPEQIHQIGLDEVARDEAAMLAIAQKLGFKDVKSLEAAIKADPHLHAATPEQLLDVYRRYIDAMRPQLPRLFGRLPRAPIEVVAVPDYIAPSQAAAYYEPGAPDGSRPGRVNINTYHLPDRALSDAESIAYHEGIPGHHLQISIAQELGGLPEFRKFEYYTAFTEGWGLYAERLGKDAGFYQDPYSDFGRLEGDMWRAIRLVVDTGVHSKRWTRQQMVDFFRAHSGIGETDIQAETDRYVAWPGQALGYKMGQLKLLELRERAQKELGTRFDIRAFHDQVLDSGALPLDILDRRIGDWIASQKEK